MPRPRRTFALRSTAAYVAKSVIAIVVTAVCCSTIIVGLEGRHRHGSASSPSCSDAGTVVGDATAGN